MRKNNKSTPFLMILVLSIIATQLFLKAFGVNITPSIGTIFHSWGKVASVIGCVYHPGLATQLDVLSNHLLHTDGKDMVETEKSRGELACNKDNDFEFEPPPAIDVNDPSVTIEEPVKVYFPKAISRCLGKKESLTIKELDVEVLQIAADSDEEGAEEEAKAEGIRSIAIGIPADDPEAGSKVSAPQFENRVFYGESESQEAPKADKSKRPCQEMERLKKLEETRRLMDEFTFENVLPFVNPTIPNFEVQASQGNKYFDKAKRVRVVIRRNPLAVPLPSSNDTFNFLTVAEESEF
jgi:hypothetical protein